jgi:hypothetical protein
MARPDAATQAAPLTTTTGFDYAQLASDVADEARATAERIRFRLGNTLLKTGQELTRIKDRLGHGHFGAWLKAEFDLTERSAENYMNAARFLEGKSERVADLPPAAIYALAAPSAPVAVVKDVLATIEAGARPLAREIKAKLAEAIEAERKAEIEAAKSPEQIKKERKGRESKAARQARLIAEQQAERDKEEREEQERVSRLCPVVERIVIAIEPGDLSELVEAIDDYAKRRALLSLLRHPTGSR